MRYLLFIVATLLAAETFAAGATPAECAADSGWNKPAQPQQLFGNSWYVGTCGLSAVLVTSEEGHILIDGATAEAAPLIENSIRELGFRVEDIRYIVNSHEHSDHAGGLAQLQRDSGATVLARGPAATVLERGRSDRGDPQFLVLDPFPAVKPVRRIQDGHKLELGGISLTAHATPGHTPGGTTWSWRSCDDRGKCLNMVYADSLTAVSDDVYRYTDEVANPGVLDSFRASIERVGKLPCDLLVSTHPSSSQLWSRLGDKAELPLVNANACRDYAANARKGLDERVAKERAGAVAE